MYESNINTRMQTPLCFDHVRESCLPPPTLDGALRKRLRRSKRSRTKCRKPRAGKRNETSRRESAGSPCHQPYSKALCELPAPPCLGQFASDNWCHTSCGFTKIGKNIDVVRRQISTSEHLSIQAWIQWIQAATQEEQASCFHTASASRQITLKTAKPNPNISKQFWNPSELGWRSKCTGHVRPQHATKGRPAASCEIEGKTLGLWPRPTASFVNWDLPARSKGNSSSLFFGMKPTALVRGLHHVSNKDWNSTAEHAWAKAHTWYGILSKHCQRGYSPSK